MTPEQQRALRTAFSLKEIGHSTAAILASGLIPQGLQDFVRTELERDEILILTPVNTLTARPDQNVWLQDLDRSSWHYWPALRQFLLTNKGWPPASIRSLDDGSDRILGQLTRPSDLDIDIRGLVLGYVQSGKTANYTAVIAKAADAGYRLIVVLSGIDNGLRRQTNMRLKRELVGYHDNRSGSVRLPPVGKQWHEFTREDLDGDFQPGFANHAALQGSQPVLLVIKKNGAVLRRLLRWLDEAPNAVLQTLPLLVIDDEADQASVDTRGTYQTEDDSPEPDYEPPSAINGLVRDLLGRFRRRVYIAYTATPFANILIPHDTVDPRVGNDLYPKDFIIALPKPAGYFGVEEYFGRMDPDSGGRTSGMRVIREVPGNDLLTLESGQLPASLEDAILDFVLAGTACICRGRGDLPATMLIHTSQRILEHARIRLLVADRFAELKDEWRYQRHHGIRDRLRKRWDTEFRPVTRTAYKQRDVPYRSIESNIGRFFEAVQVREINSSTGEVLDYDREPSLKAIAVGGNRLSRGLTLEGLITNYFIRPSKTYDTLLQMGRWLGFRAGYDDLTRVWTTRDLEGWFSELAFVEHRLREDIEIYENQGITPREAGLRIWQHPIMQVTSPNKRRFASDLAVTISYSLALEQTFKFPLGRLDDLARQSDANLLAVRQLVLRLGECNPSASDSKGPAWVNVPPDLVIAFLRQYQVDDGACSISLPMTIDYIERVLNFGELSRWTVAIRGRDSLDKTLGTVDWGVSTRPLHLINRSRLGLTDSLGVITSPGDEEVGLTHDLLARAADLIGKAQSQGKTKSRNSAAREVRPPTDGLLLLYPISRHSGYDAAVGGNRHALFEHPRGPLARDLVGLAISFPRSGRPQRSENYVQGTVGWKPME